MDVLQADNCKWTFNEKYYEYLDFHLPPEAPLRQIKMGEWSFPDSTPMIRFDYNVVTYDRVLVWFDENGIYVYDEDQKELVFYSHIGIGRITVHYARWGVRPTRGKLMKQLVIMFRGESYYRSK